MPPSRISAFRHGEQVSPEKANARRKTGFAYPQIDSRDYQPSRRSTEAGEPSKTQTDWNGYSRWSGNTANDVVNRGRCAGLPFPFAFFGGTVENGWAGTYYTALKMNLDSPRTLGCDCEICSMKLP